MHHSPPNSAAGSYAIRYDMGRLLQPECQIFEKSLIFLAEGMDLRFDHQ